MRLVDADALKAIRFHDLPYLQIVPADCDTDEKVSAYKLGWNDAIDAIVESAPTVDPVKHGHWVEQECCDWVYSKECRCSECGKYRLMTNPFGREWNYCPNCGAHMEAEDGVERK